MYRKNLERISKIGALRAEGFTIDRIAAAMGIPRSSVGYYVRRHCRGRGRVQPATLNMTPVEPRPQILPIVQSEPTVDRVEAYMQRIEEKERLTINDILEGKSTGDQLYETIVLEMFKEEPETLRLRLDLIKDLIRLAPYLQINLDRMRDMISLLLTEKQRPQEDRKSSS